MYCIIGTIICDFIEDLDCDNGVVAYQAPSEGKVHSPIYKDLPSDSGAKFDLWCGCYALQIDNRALLACAALEGYHSQATYAWYLAGESLEEVTPLLYTDRDGVYECQVTCGGVTHSRSFRLTCELCSILCLWTYDHEGVTVFTPAYIVQEWNVTLSMHTHFRSRRENLCLYFQWQKR